MIIKFYVLQGFRNLLAGSKECNSQGYRHSTPCEPQCNI